MTKYYRDADGRYIGGFDGAIPPNGAIEVPAAPDNARMIFSNGAWVYAIEQVKAEKLAELESARKRAVDTLPPVTVANKQYPATPEYREIVTGIARRKAAGRGRPARLRGKVGAEVVLTDALIDQIDDAITAAVQAEWDRYWARFDAVQAATTVAQVQSINW